MTRFPLNPNVLLQLNAKFSNRCQIMDGLWLTKKGPWRCPCYLIFFLCSKNVWTANMTPCWALISHISMILWLLEIEMPFFCPSWKLSMVIGLAQTVRRSPAFVRKEHVFTCAAASTLPKADRSPLLPAAASESRSFSWAIRARASVPQIFTQDVSPAHRHSQTHRRNKDKEWDREQTK